MRNNSAQKKLVGIYTLIVALLLSLTFSSIHLFADEEGGTSGAEFLNSIPTTRYNAMGGTSDGLDAYLEGIHYNPALLSPLDSIGLQLTFSPYPNEVSHSQASFGMHILGGVGAVSAQILNTGGFTYINEDLQPEDTVSIYDTAATVGYSRYVWNTLSLGASIKTIYRKLGDYNAIAVGGDFGAAYWLETPHFGQRPKPPTDKKLEKEFLDKKKSFDSEKEKRIKETSIKVNEAEKQKSTLENELAEIRVKIQGATEEKKPPLLEKEAAIYKKLQEVRDTLEAETDKSKTSLDEIEEWYKRALEAADEVYAKKQSDLKIVESERTRLYSVINDPTTELTEEMINTSIDETIDKTQVFLNDRAIALEEAQKKYREIRQNRITEINSEISSYKKQIDEELGPEIQKLEAELASLNTEKDALEAQEEVDKEKVQELQKKISEKERELSTAKADPWVKKLDSRIGEKEKEIEALNKDIEKKDEETKATLAETIKTVQKDIDNFDILRTYLNRELKKAKLRKELDLLKATKEKKKEKGLTVYKEREKEIYLRLLSLIYKHEEKILDARVEAMKEDYSNLIYDLETESKKELERLENEFSFQERFLNQKISDLEKITKAKSEEVDETAISELNALKAELEEKEEAFRKATDELKDREKKLIGEEEGKFEKNMSELEWEIKLTRLIYLQTDKPYLNTSVNASIQNFGSKVKFEEEGYPLPTTVHLGVGYAIWNTDNHAIKLGVQANIPFHNVFSVGVGIEYAFLNMFFARGGYTFNSPNRSFSGGVGARVGLGFTEYVVDYSIQPLPEYGILHNFGVSVYF